MGRPRNPESERVQTQIRLSPSLLDQLNLEAKRRLIGRSVLVEELLRRGLDDLVEVRLVEAP